MENANKVLNVECDTANGQFEVQKELLQLECQGLKGLVLPHLVERQKCKGCS